MQAHESQTEERAVSSSTSRKGARFESDTGVGEEKDSSSTKSVKNKWKKEKRRLKAQNAAGSGRWANTCVLLYWIVYD